MLFTKGITSYFHIYRPPHTTIRAVRHTAVSCFYTSRCVTSCFQPSLRDTSLLFYCRIPSYRVNREFLLGYLITKDSQGSSYLLLYCTIQSFPLGNHFFARRLASFAKLLVTLILYTIIHRTSYLLIEELFCLQ